MPVKWEVSGVSTIGHQAAKQGGADRCGPFHGAKILRRPGLGQECASSSSYLRGGGANCSRDFLT